MDGKQESSVIGVYLFSVSLVFVLGRFIMDSVMLEASERSWWNGIYVTFMRTHNIALLAFTSLSIIYAAWDRNEICNIFRFAFFAFWISRLLFTWNKVLDPMRRLSEENPKFVYEAETLFIASFTFIAMIFEIIHLTVTESENSALIYLADLMIGICKASVSASISIVCLYFLHGQWACYIPASRGLNHTSHQVHTSHVSLLANDQSENLKKISEFGFVSCGGIRTEAELFADLVARMYISLSLQFQLITRIMAFSIFTAAFGLTHMITSIFESACIRTSHATDTNQSNDDETNSSGCSSNGSNVNHLYVVLWIQEVLPVFFYLVFVSPPALLKGDIWKELGKKIVNAHKRDKLDDEFESKRTNRSTLISDIEVPITSHNDIRLINPVYVDMCIDSSRPMSERLMTILQSNDSKEEEEDVPTADLDPYSMLEIHMCLTDLLLIDNETNVPIPVLFTGRQTFIVGYIESMSSKTSKRYNPNQALPATQFDNELPRDTAKSLIGKIDEENSQPADCNENEIDDDDIELHNSSQDQFDVEETLLDAVDEESAAIDMRASAVGARSSITNKSLLALRRLSGSVIEVKPTRLSMSEDAQAANKTSRIMPIFSSSPSLPQNTIQSENKATSPPRENDGESKRVWRLLGVTEDAINNPNPSFSVGFYVPRNLPPSTRIRFDIYNYEEAIATPLLVCQRYIRRLYDDAFTSDEDEAEDSVSKVMVGQIIVSIADLETSLRDKSGVRFGRSSYQNPLNSNLRSFADNSIRYLSEAQESYYCEVVRPIPILHFRKKIRRCGGLIRLTILPVNLSPRVFISIASLTQSEVKYPYIEKNLAIRRLNVNCCDEDLGSYIVRSFLTFVRPFDFDSKSAITPKSVVLKRLTKFSNYEKQAELSTMVQQIEGGVEQFSYDGRLINMSDSKTVARKNANVSSNSITLSEGLFKPAKLVVTDELGTSLVVPIPLVRQPFALRIREEMLECDLGFIVPQLYIEAIFPHRQADLNCLSKFRAYRASTTSYVASVSLIDSISATDGDAPEHSWLSSIFEKFRSHVLSFDFRLSLSDEANIAIERANDPSYSANKANSPENSQIEEPTTMNENESFRASVMRYRFRPSRLKKKEILSHIPLNLHIQVMYSSQDSPISPVNITSLHNGISSTMISKQASSSINVKSQRSASCWRPQLSQKAQHFITCGAFAAHSSGYRKGGILQLHEKAKRRAEELRCGQEILSCLSEQPISLKNWIMQFPCDQDLISSLVLAQIRFDVCFSQALATLATAFVSKLEFFAASIQRCEQSNFGLSASDDCRIMDLISEAGFFVEFESLLSTQGDENGMLEDFYAAVCALSNVTLAILPAANATKIAPPVSSPRISMAPEAQCRISNLAKVYKLSQNVQFIQLTMASSIPTDVCLNFFVDPSLLAKLPLSIRIGNPIAVRPIMFSVGINEMQSVANTVGSTNLQDSINVGSSQQLHTYYGNVLRSVLLSVFPECGQPYDKLSEGDCRHSMLFRSRNSRLSVDAPVEVNETKQPDHAYCRLPQSDIEIVDMLLEDIMSIVSTSTHAVDKHWQLLTVVSDFVRMVGGSRVTSCKSGKDRTGMSITFEEARCLRSIYGIDGNCLNELVSSLRAQGVRISNAKKNVGLPKYAFNAFQRRMLPEVYQPPARSVAKTDS